MSKLRQNLAKRHAQFEEPSIESIVEKIRAALMTRDASLRGPYVITDDDLRERNPLRSRRTVGAR